MNHKVYRPWLVAAAVLGLAAPVFGAYGDVVASFRAPANKPLALAPGDGVIYCFCKTSPYLIWKINPQNGGVLGSFKFGETGVNTGGLAYDGVYLWAGNSFTDRVYRFAWGGSVASSFKADWNVARGLTWSGFHLWGSQRGGEWSYYFYQMRIDGKVIRSFISYYVLYDLATDGRYLWMPQYDDVEKSYRIVALSMANGAFVTSFDSPADGARGAAYDGTYLWLSTLADDGWIWKVDVCGVGVEPVSLGRIKTLYK